MVLTTTVCMLTNSLVMPLWEELCPLPVFSVYWCFLYFYVLYISSLHSRSIDISRKMNISDICLNFKAIFWLVLTKCSANFPFSFFSFCMLNHGDVFCDHVQFPQSLLSVVIVSLDQFIALLSNFRYSVNCCWDNFTVFIHLWQFILRAQLKSSQCS